MPPIFGKNKDEKEKGKDGEQKKGDKKPKLSPWQQFTSNILSIILIFLILITGFSLFSDLQKDVEEIPISQLAQQVKQENVKKIVVEGEKLILTLSDDTEKESKKEEGTALSETLINYGVTPEQLEKVEIDVQRESGFLFWAGNVLPFLIPILFIILIFWFISRQMKGAGMQAFSFGQSKARIIDPADKEQRVVFKDVAGVKEAKEELKEVVDFLRNPKKFLDIGARIPKGVLLMGAPGTGKTLLARAVAGEARVPFFHLSGAEFVEMFVGVGASRTRDLFKMAKKAAPAIVFIDEIDAVGRVRGSGMGGGNDEREQTLNQILVEMDGFEPNEKVIVMAATNRPDVLDPALLRPGRFDRRVTLELPDRQDREQILGVHAKKKPLGADVDLMVISERTPGFSGADLYSLMNEAAILAAREKRKEVSQYDLIRSIEKVMLGPERRSRVISRREKQITAYHEAGHALVASVLPHADPVHKISIIARGHAGGYTLKLPIEERRMQSKKEFLDDLAMSLGGYVAEIKQFGDLTTGPSNDLQVATGLARDMVTKYGMSEDMGPVALESSGGKTLMGRGASDREYSEDVSAKIDAEVKRLMSEARDRAETAINENSELLDAVVAELMENETIERKEFEELLKKHDIKPKKAPEEKVIEHVETPKVAEEKDAEQNSSN